MSKAKPTPGPWRSHLVQFSEETWRAFLNTESMRCITDGHNVIAAIWDTEDDDNPNQRDRFNAELIVKCVSLHEELVGLLKEVEADYLASTSFGVNDPLWERVKAALAKAEGRS